MLSVVCVYNNEDVLNRVLLKSVNRQSIEVELILVDNRNASFPSAAAALNFGGKQAKGDFLVFAHQDMWFSDPYWMEEAGQMLPSIPQLGVAGVAGISDQGNDRGERLKSSLEVFDKPFWDRIGQVDKPVPVQTLDECLLIIPRKVFSEIKFDEQRFDGWDCYGADYCLSVANHGYKAYVVPLTCIHCCKRGNRFVWEFPGLLTYQKRLFRKHRDKYPVIYTYLLDINRKNLVLTEVLKHLWPLYLKLFPIFTKTLNDKLKDCHAVLDLGCGHYSPLSDFDIPCLIGVDCYSPSLEESKRIGTHHISILGDVRTLAIKSKSVDAVVAVEVLEKLSKGEGRKLMAKMENWARKKVIIVTPNGNLGTKNINKNPFQEQKCEWTTEELRKLGYQVSGIGGWIGPKNAENVIEFSIWRNRLSHISQRIIKHLPKSAMKLLATKELEYESVISETDPAPHS